VQNKVQDKCSRKALILSCESSYSTDCVSLSHQAKVHTMSGAIAWRMSKMPSITLLLLFLLLLLLLLLCTGSAPCCH
jgi:hypothetical protein